MIFTDKISLFRFTVYRGHDILITRARGFIAMCYMNGPFPYTRLVDARRSRILPPQVGHKNNEDFTDWVQYNMVPDHVPDEQWFSYYKVMWDKYKDED